MTTTELTGTSASEPTSSKWMALLAKPSAARVMVVGGVLFTLLSLTRMITDGDDLTSSGTMSTTLRVTTPILLAGLAGLWAERVGIVNIGIEGQMLMGAFVGFLANVYLGRTGLPVGLVLPLAALIGALTGAAMGALLAFLAGRKVGDPGDSRTNVDLLGLARAAAGKDWPRKVNTRIVHEVGDYNFGVQFDTCHAHMVAAVGARQPGKKETLPGGAVEFARKLRGKINHVHLIDSDGTLHDDETSTHAPFGDGILDFATLLPELNAAGVPHNWWTIDLCFWPDAWAVTARCKAGVDAVSYTHLTLPTTYSV